MRDSAVGGLAVGSRGGAVGSGCTVRGGRLAIDRLLSVGWLLAVRRLAWRRSAVLGGVICWRWGRSTILALRRVAGGRSAVLWLLSVWRLLSVGRLRWLTIWRLTLRRRSSILAGVVPWWGRGTVGWLVRHVDFLILLRAKRESVVRERRRMRS